MIKNHLSYIIVNSRFPETLFEERCKRYYRICVFISLFFISVTAVKAAAKEESFIKEYPVKENAYIKDGSNAARNYNYEDITSAHGAQCAGKGYRVIKSKYSNTGEIIAVMKFDLPSSAEITTNGFDKYQSQFIIFKNADKELGARSGNASLKDYGWRNY